MSERRPLSVEAAAEHLGCSPRIIDRSEAARCGLAKYYTGKQCKRGHLAHRWVVSRVCVRCGREDIGARRRQPGGLLYNLEYSRTWRRRPDSRLQHAALRRRQRAGDVTLRLRDALSARIRNALKGRPKSAKTAALIGCSIDDLRHCWRANSSKEWTGKITGQSGTLIICDHARHLTSQT